MNEISKYILNTSTNESFFNIEFDVCQNISLVEVRRSTVWLITGRRCHSVIATVVFEIAAKYSEYLASLSGAAAAAMLAPGGRQVLVEYDGATRIFSWAPPRERALAGCIPGHGCAGKEVDSTVKTTVWACPRCWYVPPVDAPDSGNSLNSNGPRSAAMGYVRYWAGKMGSFSFKRPFRKHFNCEQGKLCEK